MLLSEMFGVEREVDFKVKGYESLFKVILNAWGEEHLMFKLPCVSTWEPVPHGMLCSVIFAAPAGIIHLPPPLTDEQREQLRALYTIGYFYLTKDKYGTTYTSPTKPEKKARDTWLYENGDWNVFKTNPTKCLEPLISWSDPEPFDIGKALGVGE